MIKEMKQKAKSMAAKAIATDVKEKIGIVKEILGDEELRKEFVGLVGDLMIEISSVSQSLKQTEAKLRAERKFHNREAFHQGVCPLCFGKEIEFSAHHREFRCNLCGEHMYLDNKDVEILGIKE